MENWPFSCSAGTLAMKSCSAWSLVGTKIAVPGGAHADAWLVTARTAGADSDPTGVAVFLVEKGAPGVTVRGYAMQDGAAGCDLVLQDARATLLHAAGLLERPAGDRQPDLHVTVTQTSPFALAQQVLEHARGYQLGTRRTSAGNALRRPGSR